MTELCLKRRGVHTKYARCSLFNGCADDRAARWQFLLQSSTILIPSVSLGRNSSINASASFTRDL